MDKDITRHHQEAEQKIIHLMLKDRRAIDDLVQNGYSSDLFDKHHQPIVHAIYEEFLDGNRLLTADSYRQRMVTQGRQADIPLSMDVFAKCDLKAYAVMDDLGMLKKQLIDAYMARRFVEGMNSYRKNTEKKGHYNAALSFSEDLQYALSLANFNKTMFTPLDEFKQDYLGDLKDRINSPEAKITCGIEEIDSTMGVGFKPQHLTLFVADVGGHKCVKGDARIYLSRGDYVTAEALYNNRLGRPCRASLPKLMSMNSNFKVNPQSAVWVGDNGIKECFKVKTRLGFELDVTGNHPIYTLLGYKKVEELKPGCYVGLSRKMPFGTETPEDGLPEWLGCMYSGGDTTQSTLTFTNFDDQIVQRIDQATTRLGGKLNIKKNDHEEADGSYYISGMLAVTREYDLQGKYAVEKNIHPSIFRWDKQSVSSFLQAMYGCDGSLVVTKEGRISVVYSSLSKQLAEDVRTILLKFGIIASLSSIKVNYKEEYLDSWQVKISDAKQINSFIEEIGFLGDKQDIAISLYESLKDKKSNRDVNLIPPDIWTILEEKFKKHNKSHYRNVGKSISRDLLDKIAGFLDNDSDLKSIANSDIVWDEIVSIENIGLHRTYDISMKKDPNFVVDNFITHNTNMMLNVALNVWRKGHNVLFIPLEMNRHDLTNRILANQTEIPYRVFGSPDAIGEQKWSSYLPKIEEAEIWQKGKDNAQFCILDADERSTVSQVQREIEKRAFVFKPKLVVIDYVALMKPDKSVSRDRNDLQIGEILKSLRFLGKKHGFHIMTCAQMGRQAIKSMRDSNDSVPDSTSIRGSHEYSADADTIYALMKVQGEEDRLRIYTLKARHGRAGQVQELRVFPETCRIVGTSATSTLAGGGESIIDVMKESDEDIAEEIQKHDPFENKNIKFARNTDLDPLGDDSDDSLLDLT